MTSGNGYPSELLARAVDEFASLPGIGRRSALRLALHLMKQPVENVEKFASAFTDMRRNLRHCRNCNMISDGDVCSVCSDMLRDRSVICVVESVRDVISIEATGQYRGLYHVLGAIISPLEGIGPSDLPVAELVERASSPDVKEVVMALSTSPEGETTSFYLFRKLAGLDVKVTAIARGIGFGDDLEYADEFTLGKSIANRQIFSPGSF